MEETATVTCPYCGQQFDLAVDTSAGPQRFTTDCEVCCRPMNVSVECGDGGILSLEITGE